ncbi:MAG: hypothetical protein WAQ08_19430 [Aquabacterium sp.]|jgi:hypothetical protein|uniref:hypothetical protein n=1 Tax=Aquabacterium sp. TaxID=1872578 RepID=UPI003BB05B01
MAHAAPSPATNKLAEPVPPQFTFTLGVPEIQALLAIVGLTRGGALDTLYQALEYFHEQHDIERKEVSEPHDIHGFDLDRLVDWWSVEEATDA